MKTNKLSPAVTGQGCADQRTLETAERLTEIYKKEFGADWQQVFKETVAIDLGHA
jgi:hypothetical protein